MRKVVKIDDILKDVECLENWEVKDLLDKLYSKYPVEFSDTFGDTDVDTFVDEHEDEIIERLAWNNSEIDILKQLDDNRILEYVADTFTLDSVFERVIINLANSDPERFGKFITEKIIKK